MSDNPSGRLYIGGALTQISGSQIEGPQSKGTLYVGGRLLVVDGSITEAHIAGLELDQQHPFSNQGSRGTWDGEPSGDFPDRKTEYGTFRDYAGIEVATYSKIMSQMSSQGDISATSTFTGSAIFTETVNMAERSLTHTQSAMRDEAALAVGGYGAEIAKADPVADEDDEMLLVGLI